jgi:hypothetical protein
MYKVDNFIFVNIIVYSYWIDNKAMFTLAKFSAIMAAIMPMISHSILALATLDGATKNRNDPISVVPLKVTKASTAAYTSECHVSQ